MEISKLKKQLLLLQKRDQMVRQPGTRWDPSVDRKITKRLREIVRQVGWQTISHIGEDGVRAVWLIAQHSPDIRFQKKCLEFFKKSMKRRGVSKKHIAFLTDRIRTREGKPQLFGTQFKVDKKTNKFVPFPIARQRDLDNRRIKYGLEPFEVYRQRFKNEDVPEFKKKFKRPRQHRTIGA